MTANVAFIDLIWYDYLKDKGGFMNREEERENKKYRKRDILERLGLTCRKCNGETEIIVEREAAGKIIRFEGGSRVTTTKPTHRGKLCFYHRKKAKGGFENPKRTYPRHQTGMERLSEWKRK